MNITFNVPIKAGSAYSSIVMMNTNDNSAKPILTSIAGNILTITPTYNWLQFVTYQLIIPINSITDLSGNTLTSAFITSFKCNNVADTTPPTVTTTYPANNTNNVPTNKVITINFNEPIQTGSAYSSIVMKNTNDNSVKPIVTIITGNILTIKGTYNWLKFVTYKLTIHANSITDLAGNSITTNYITSFKIG
jgi:hypothetical protein